MTLVSPPWFFLDSLKQCLEIHRTESVAFPRPTGTRKRKTTLKKKHSIPRAPSVRGFTALCNGSVSIALNRSHVFPALYTGLVFLPRFTRLTLDALCTCLMFFPRFTLVAWVSCFSRALQWFQVLRVRNWKMVYHTWFVVIDRLWE